MAELPPPTLRFDGACPDCGERVARLPLPIPGVEDDFDWRVRDYDSFRLFMMQELASRFPERQRWTPADTEVVIVELLAAALDRASHALDRVQGERFIDSARRPESVRRLLGLIGWQVDPATQTDLAEAEAARVAALNADLDPEDQIAPRDMSLLIEEHWRRNPTRMEAARRAGPRRVFEQNRMVTAEDHEVMLRSHPLVALAKSRLVWTGSWQSLMVAALLVGDLGLDDPLHEGAPAEVPSALRPDLWAEVVLFHEVRGLPLPPVNAALSGRRILRGMIEQYRMIGSEVFLETARPATVTLVLSVRARPGYFRSELRQALAQVFTADTGGFFEPGRLGFGAALYASDIIEAAMQVEGVAVACLNLMKRAGRKHPDQTAEGVIPVADDEFIRCMNDPTDPGRGTFRIDVNGGEAG
ncbi:hypothetical protein [Mesobacterium pallidum]|uniref:hypothetical protein n=1 Tax=Mesobacterium pallidum TaxID=2872037 RepID=UPI001EE2C62C|nr:hypothetical protein [Mesobacterium pallidum]